ncbi:cation:proton antiporter [Rhodospirillum rubrum]|uniref:DUF4040 domain-containing protein n=1 Tax=Rhodospirillum rubrum TaxID=1085 RepID=UPI001905D141|nr:DUF4040 domain-containing protein [Rhodospirillum rubrum]MBK1664324.1 cation:proton antiporter [Rhodospirillum rubrum]MBK1676769.1 cation:proton antiporter [Rhodospirillum rubrum]
MIDDPGLWIDIAMFACLAATALAILKGRDLFPVAMLSGIFSLLSAGIFTLLDAVDVAFTEASVGAGITTVLFLGTISLVGSREKPIRRANWPALTTVLVTGTMLIWATLDMPAFGDPAAPIHHHVADHYIAESGREIGMPNIVTSVLASYRGFDTLGETTVIFTAGMAVVALLGGAPLLAPFRRKRKKAPPPKPAPGGE